MSARRGLVEVVDAVVQLVLEPLRQAVPVLRSGDMALGQALATWAGLVSHPESVTATVKEITGAPARTFRQWAAGHVSDFRLP